MAIIFNCSNPACRERIEADESQAGNLASCPACGTELHVPVSKDIEFDCTNPRCGLHIVVDISEAGRVVVCPGCKKVLRIPGDPPKSIAAARTSTQRPRARASATRESIRGLILSRAWNLLLGWGTGAALFGLILLGVHLRSLALTPPHLDEIAEEIYSHGGTKGEVVEGALGKALYYFQEDDQDLDVFRVDRATLEQTRLFHFENVVRNDTFKWLGWSPDRRLAAYINQPTGRKGKLKLFVCDGDNGKSKDVFEIDTDGSLSEGIWLSPTSLVLLNRHNTLFLFNFETAAQLGPFGARGLVKLRAISGGGPDFLTGVSDRSIAYFRGGFLRTLDIPAGEEKNLARLPAGTPTELSYDRIEGKYLFLFRDAKDKDNWSIYRCDPGSTGNASLTCIVGGDGFYPRWIPEGKGIAYITSSNDVDRLVLETGSTRQRTNVLSSGDAKVYIAGTGNGRVYAAAVDDLLMWRIWEYDVDKKSLRKIVPSNEEPTRRRVVPPVLASLTNAVNKRVDYYYVPPAGMVAHKKYPVVIDECSANRYDQCAQFIANVGVFYVSPNRFGTNRWDAMPELEDTVAVYRELLKHPNVDPDRIYLSGHSVSTTRTCELANMHPQWWRGIILISPSPQSLIWAKPADYPGVYISVGDSDKFMQLDYRGGSHQYVMDACRNSIPVQIDVIHAGHTYNSPQLMECYKSVAKFLMADK